MLGEQTTGAIEGIRVQAVSHTPPQVTINGQPGQLAVIAADGSIVAIGVEVAREVEAAVINCLRNTMKGQGFLRVLSNPIQPLKQAA
ncbi:hypothetical protein INP81_07325 [Comamonas thiooxydans]|uniref:hypothetical protein n=1 Tax=Comamonas thiooxydans TaxID=363952 RepID=UPI0018A666B0|nr:hypothetical protein [Comamonas thiooxydans]QOQ83678.1 hypothetical protein INP81_07325 [Comamonas thiooxydans]